MVEERRKERTKDRSGEIHADEIGTANLDPSNGVDKGSQRYNDGDVDATQEGSHDGVRDGDDGRLKDGRDDAVQEGVHDPTDEGEISEESGLAGYGSKDGVREEGVGAGKAGVSSRGGRQEDREDDKGGKAEPSHGV